MTSYSVLTPFMPTRSEQIYPLAALVNHTGACRLWQGQALIVDPYQTFAAAAGAGFHIPVGVGVGLMPFRHPFDAALAARSLALGTGHPVVAGFGPGAPILQQAMLGQPYPSPLTATREYLSIVAGLVRGEEVDHSGEYFRCRFQMAGPPVPDIEVGVGVLRPRMATLAGELADVAITWLTPASYVQDEITPRLTAAAATVGRKPPRVAVVVPVCLPRNGVDPVDVFLAGSAGHLRLPHYQDMLRRAGVLVDVDDPAKTVRSGMERGVFIYADTDELPEFLGAFGAAGADEIVLNTTGLSQHAGFGVALDGLGAILRAVT